ncbi:24.5 kDa Thymidine kinase [Spodoptera frugiperda ascovirus 1a]|uniref:Thymidine kinase n=1 Tax=Spodoptera frugiperda ascovirus 1a TaxID=113370 RepID=Q8JJY6_SFAVA|nr:24.5 kDa Thymidine kinase [Spodoptera frugiperda ascovirus 1a]CAC84464.1 thymidine kinase [Spodoptera frugiperda ascovirus 1a]CAL44640.1 24.5 kDa Thymidine kinase [Spodoptera frugiperda ascovirus 1a]
MTTDSVVFVSVEGNIGSGKSSVMRKAAERYDGLVYFCEEPVEEWGLLMYMYNDPARYAFPFELQVLTSKYQKWLDSYETCLRTGARVVIMERSPWSAYDVFTRMMRDRGSITDKQFDVYTDVFRSLENDIPRIDHVVYIDTKPDTCHRRAQERGREAEKSLDVEYFERVECYTKRYVDNHSSVFVLNGNLPREDVLASFNRVLDGIVESS